MKVIKNINNNVAICVDGSGNELIAFGKGVGYKTAPYDIDDLSIIHRTYYDINPRFLELVNQIDDRIFEIAAEAIEYASSLNAIFDPNVVFTLADHIQFAIDRASKGMKMKFSLYYELDYSNQEEIKIGKYTCELVKKELGIILPEEEAYGIALHLLNAQAVESANDSADSNKINIIKITEIIENHFDIKINKEGFNYSRFVSHMEHLFKRSKEGDAISSANIKMFEALKKEYPDAYDCAGKIKDYFKEKVNIELNDEELLYLLLHINRLCSREDCYR